MKLVEGATCRYTDNQRLLKARPARWKATYGAEHKPMVATINDEIDFQALEKALRILFVTNKKLLVKLNIRFVTHGNLDLLPLPDSQSSIKPNKSCPETVRRTKLKRPDSREDEDILSDVEIEDSELLLPGISIPCYSASTTTKRQIREKEAKDRELEEAPTRGAIRRR